jgi:hypothetical protein
MNSINASTGFSNFQICLGQSPHLIPPLIPNSLAPTMMQTDEAQRARKLIVDLQTDVDKVKDNLLQAKVFQSFYENQHRSPELPFKIGDKVMLSTLYCRQEFKNKSEKQAAKFFHHSDSLHHIIDAHAVSPNYTLKLQNLPNTYPTYHTSELKPFLLNDTSLFPSCELPQSQPILTPDRLEEYLVEEILDSHKCEKGHQYLIYWSGYGPKHDWWLSGSALTNCKALNVWQGRSDAATQ